MIEKGILCNIMQCEINMKYIFTNMFYILNIS